MSDLDDLNKHLKEIYQVLIRHGHEKFLETCDVADQISRKKSLTATYIIFCNESGLKQDKKISLWFMKFDVRNGFTWTTCLADSLVALPEIQCLKVEILTPPFTEILTSAFLEFYAQSRFRSRG